MAPLSKPAAPDRSARELIAIQWLRAIAALMVVFHHTLFYEAALHVTEPDPQAERELFGFSSWWFGIHIFFVVSGFIMVHAAPDFGEAGAWRRFLMRRFLRIAPLYWLIMLPIAAGAFLAPHTLEIAGDKLSYILRSFAFIPVARTPGDIRPLLGQGWTLDYEMYFYVLFAASMLVSRHVAIIALTLLFLTLAFIGRSVGTQTPIAFVWTDGLILEFLFGVYLGLAYEKGLRIGVRVAWIAGLVGVALVILKLQGPTPLIAGAPAALIVGALTLGPRPASFIWGAALAALGDASYSLYLTHTLVIRPLKSVWLALGWERLPDAAYLVAATTLSVAVALLVHRFIEKPMTRALQNRFASRRPAPSLEAAPV